MADIVEELIAQIEQCENKAYEIWDTRMEFGKSPQKAVRHNGRLMQEVRPIDLIEERLFSALWTALEDFDDFDVITNKVAGKTRFTYCDGRVHLVTNKRDEYLYGTVCECE